MTTIETLEAPPAEAQSMPPRPSLWSALRVRDFRLVWIGESISLLGDQFYFIALPWLTFQLTGSALALGSVAAVGGIPRAIFMLLGGAITDRFSPHKVMWVSNVLRILLTGLITATILTHTLQVWLLYVASFLFGLVDAFFIPAQSAILPQIVDKDQLQSGNALNQITSQLAGLIGPALAGLVIASLAGGVVHPTGAEGVAPVSTEGIGLALGFDTLTFVVAALALWLMKGGRNAAPSEGQMGFSGMMRSIGEGIRLVWADPLIRVFLLIIAAINFLFNGPIGVGLPVLVTSHFKGGADLLGILYSAFGGGALIGALAAGGLPTPRKTGVWSMVCVAFAGAMMALFGVVTSLPVFIAITALMGLSIGYVNVMAAGTTQRRIAPEAMGRVMSLMMLASFGLGPISNLVAGLMADVNLEGMYLGAGFLLIMIPLYFATHREVRGFVKENA